MYWPHTIRITRASSAPGTQDAETGAWSPGGDPVVLYVGDGDMQHRIRTIRRGPENDRAVQSDADVFLRDESNLWNVPEGAIIEITDGESVNLQGVVVSMDKLSGVLFVGQLVPNTVDEVPELVFAPLTTVSMTGEVLLPGDIPREWDLTVTPLNEASITGDFINPADGNNNVELMQGSASLLSDDPDYGLLDSMTGSATLLSDEGTYGMMESTSMSASLLPS